MQLSLRLWIWAAALIGGLLVAGVRAAPIAPAEVPGALLSPPPDRVVREFGRAVMVRIVGEFNAWWNSYFAMTLAVAAPMNSKAASSASAIDISSRPRGNQGHVVVASEIRRTKSEVERSLLMSVAPAQNISDTRAELARWDDAAKHRPQTGPGGTAWDAQYRSFIQTDESAVSKGFPTHAEAARAILADAAQSVENLRRHKGWVLFIKHFSQSYRPESATADLKRLYEDLVALESKATTAIATLPFEGDAQLIIHRNVVYGRTHPEMQKLDAYLVKSSQPTALVIEIHGGGWRRGSKSQFVYQGDLRQRIRDASPLFLVSTDDPPALIVGTWSEDLAVLRDPPVPAVINDPHSAWHGILLAEAMRRFNVPAVVRIGPEVGKDAQLDNAAIVAFLRERLDNRARAR